VDQWNCALRRLCRVFSGIRIASVTVADHLSGGDVSAGRHDMAKPGRPGAVVGDPAEARRNQIPVARRLGFEDHRLVKAGPASPWLIDDESGEFVSDGIREPAFGTARRRIQRRPRMRRPVDHDERPPPSLLWDLELDIHLADRYLLRRATFPNGRGSGISRDLWHTTDEERTLIADGQRCSTQIATLERAFPGQRVCGKHAAHNGRHADPGQVSLRELFMPHETSQNRLAVARRLFASRECRS
jgi:hypothetical protein